MSLEWILLGLRILATVILCAFLSVAFYLIWRQLRATEAQQTTGSIPNVDQLRVISAAQGQPLAVGQTLPLYPGLILGSGPENTIIVNPAVAVAGQVRLSRKDGAWRLENLEQAGVVKLNNALLAETAPLSPGDVIAIGDTQFCFETAR